ncbi:hypothetical protein HMPREF0889_0857 [Megasphaera lornae]|uniref:Uncharacterized protein n=1 Tax=Megasphaera lornae TaxID=1000568 RepID=D3LTZ4_9FIRM|nr:hypothetical protein HMPREF0889_0857 [Megasphaera genomosp. type_1 str. 28L]
MIIFYKLTYASHSGNRHVLSNNHLFYFYLNSNIYIYFTVTIFSHYKDDTF